MKPDFEVMRLPSLIAAKMVGYADDLGIVVLGKNTRIEQVTVNRSIRQKTTWLTRKKLSLATQKTEVVLLTPEIKVKSIIVKVGETCKY